MEKSRLTAQQIDYIECHGTGTSLGDPIEANAISTVYAEARDTPLLIGSVKTNIGHLEAASGIAGFIKTVLALEKEQIPASLNYHHLNPHIDFHETVKVANTNYTWSNTPDKLRYAGVSSFGFSGTNAHVIVGQSPIKQHLNPNVRLPDKHLFVLSAKSLKSLEATISSYVTYLENTEDDLANICYTLAVGRQHFSHRLVIPATSKHELRNLLMTHTYKIIELKLNDEKVRPTSLDELLKAYEEGKQIDWHDYYAPYKSTLMTVSLPNYCFQKNAYWLPIGSSSE